MSSTALTIKLASSVVLVGGVAGGIGFTYSKGWFGNPESYVYVISESSNLTHSETDELKNGDKKNYECKFTPESTQNVFDCQITKLNLSTTGTKSFFASKMNEINSEAKTTKSNLKEDKSIFKVKVNLDFFNSLKWDNTKKFEIFSTGTSSTKVGSLTPLFGVHGSNIKGKVEYSVGKVDSYLSSSDTIVNSEAQLTSTSGQTKCLFIKNSNTEINCQILQYTTDSTPQNDLTKLNFSKGTTELTNIDKNKYYLYKFTNTSDAQMNSSFKDNAKAKVTLSTAVTVGSDSVNALRISNLTPAVIAGATNSEKIFLLK